MGDILKFRYVGIHGKGFLHEVILTAMVAESLLLELEVFVQPQQSKAYLKGGRACAGQISLYEGQFEELMLDENSSKETKGFGKNPDVESIQKSKAASKNAFGVDEHPPVFLSSLSKVMVQGALEMKNMDSVLHYLHETRMENKKVDEDVQKRSSFEHEHASSDDLFKGEGTGFMDGIVYKNERESPQGLADIVWEVISFDPVTKVALAPRNKVACFSSGCLGEKGILCPWIHATLAKGFFLRLSDKSPCKGCPADKISTLLTRQGKGVSSCSPSTKFKEKRTIHVPLGCLNRPSLYVGKHGTLTMLGDVLQQKTMYLSESTLLLLGDVFLDVISDDLKHDIFIPKSSLGPSVPAIFEWVVLKGPTVHVFLFGSFAEIKEKGLHVPLACCKRSFLDVVHYGLMVHAFLIQRAMFLPKGFSKRSDETWLQSAVLPSICSCLPDVRQRSLEL